MAALLAAMPSKGDESLAEGNPRSPVRVVIYEDLQCSDCAAFRKMMDEQLLPKFGAKAAFEHRDFPLPKHNWARQAAIAARHFERQSASLGVKWRRFALENRKSIALEDFPSWLKKFCGANGVPAADAAAALGDPQLAALVDRDYQEGIARGIAKTPTVLVNGQPFVESFPLEEISQAIESAVKEAGL
jgi:protein-disulfide isomerase